MHSFILVATKELGEKNSWESLASDPQQQVGFRGQCLAHSWKSRGKRLTGVALKTDIRERTSGGAICYPSEGQLFHRPRCTILTLPKGTAWQSKDPQKAGALWVSRWSRAGGET